MTLVHGIPIANIYYMIAYAFRELPVPEAQSVSAEDFCGLYDLFAWILDHGIGTQLKRGLYRRYETRQEEGLRIRGRIDINETLRRRAQNPQEVSCVFDELTADNPVNRVIKSTALLLVQKAELSDERKKSLRSKLNQLPEISEIDLHRIPWSALSVPPGDRITRWMLTICRFIRENLLMSTEDGGYFLAQEFKDKNIANLYESFIREFYKKEHPSLNPAAEHIAWAVPKDQKPTLLPEMRTDITLSNGNNILIIDAKFYGKTLQKYYDKQAFHSHNLYQIFTYVKNKEAEVRDLPAHKVSGMLLYAQTAGDEELNERFSIDGNEFCVRTLNLNRDFSDIREDLLSISQEFFPQARQ